MLLLGGDQVELLDCFGGKVVEYGQVCGENDKFDVEWFGDDQYLGLYCFGLFDKG